MTGPAGAAGHYARAMNLVTPAPWLVDRAPPAGLDSHQDTLVDALKTPGARALVWGPPGSGKVAFAGAIASRIGRPVVAVRLAGCRKASEALLGLGLALGAIPPGDSSQVARRLRALGDPLVILGLVDSRSVAAVCESLSALAPRCTWLCLANQEVLDDVPRVELPPQAPSPLETALEDLGHDPAWSVLDTLPSKALDLCWLPAGARSTSSGLPRPLETRLEGGRIAARPEVIRAVMAEARTDPSDAAARLAPHFEDALAMAHGAPVPDLVGLPELLALRWLGEVHRDPDEAPRATAAAVRLLGAWGLASEALQLADRALRRDAQARPQARALLLWARATAALRVGATAEAEEGWRGARELLEDAGDLELMAALARDRAQRQGLRGDTSGATSAWREARVLLRQLGDASGVALTLRGAADLAVAQGEVLGAETLYEQAEATPTTDVEIANRRLGEAGLALSRGELQRVQTLLREIDELLVPDPLLAAGRLRRQAELALRQGSHANARRLALEAATSYGHLGEPEARAHTVRLAGDAAAAQGALSAAAESYSQAMALQVRMGDLRGLQRTVRHAQALVDDAGLTVASAAIGDLALGLSSHLEAPEQT